MHSTPNPAPAPHVLRGAHATDVTCALFASPSSSRAVHTADADGVVVAWDVRTRRMVGAPTRAHGASSGVLSMRGVARGVATQGRDGSVKFWALPGDGDGGDGEAVAAALGAEDVDARSSAGASRSFCRLASDGGEYVACAGAADGSIVVMRASDGKIVCVAPAVGGGDGDENEDADAADAKVGMATCVAFVPSRKTTPMVFAGYEDGSVILWALDIIDGGNPASTGLARVMWRARAHAETVLCASADASGTGAMSGGADGAAVRYAFDVDDDTHSVAVHIVRTHAPYANVVSSAMKQPGVSAVAIRADDKIVACGCWDGKVRVFEYKAKSKGRLLAVLKYHEDVVTDVAFAPDGSVLVSAARDGLVCLWPIFPP